MSWCLHTFNVCLYNRYNRLAWTVYVTSVKQQSGAPLTLYGNHVFINVDSVCITWQLRHYAMVLSKSIVVACLACV